MKLSTESSFATLLSKQRALISAQAGDHENPAIGANSASCGGSLRLRPPCGETAERVTLSPSSDRCESRSASVGATLSSNLGTPHNGSSHAAASGKGDLPQADTSPQRLTSEKLRTIYEDMWSALAQDKARQWAILLQTSQEISELLRQAHEARMEASQVGLRSMLADLSRCQQE